MYNDVRINGVHINEHMRILRKMMDAEEWLVAITCASMLLRNIRDVHSAVSDLRDKAIYALEAEEDAFNRT